MAEEAKVKMVQGMCRTTKAVWDSEGKRIERGETGSFTTGDFKATKDAGLTCDPKGDIAEEVLKELKG